MAETSAQAAPDTTGRWPEAVTDVPSRPFPWWTVLITGIAGVVFGIAVLVWPELSLRIMAALAGVWLLVGGIARVIGAFLPTGGSIARHVLSGIVGIIVLIAGLICLRNLVTRLALLALLFAITWILSGLAALMMGLQRTGPVRVLLIIVGALSMIAGIIFLVTPSLSLATLVVLTGISSLVVGLSEVFLAFSMRRAVA
jgi:uncharacterized membrane protein HdeD (DUF308 family)